MRQFFKWFFGALAGIILLAIAFLVALIAMAPATTVTEAIATTNLQLEKPTGSLWKGSADAYFETHYVGALQWQTSFLDLLRREPKIFFALDEPDIRLNLAISYDFSLYRANIDGNIHSRFINKLTQAYDIQLSNDIQFKDVFLAFKESNNVQEASGEIFWEGGPVRFKLSALTQEMLFDSVRGIVALDGESIQIMVLLASTSTPVMEFRLDTNSGWLHIKAFHAFLEFANFPSMNQKRNSDFLFEVSEKIL